MKQFTEAVGMVNNNTKYNKNKNTKQLQVSACWVEIVKWRDIHGNQEAHVMFEFVPVWQRKL